MTEYICVITCESKPFDNINDAQEFKNNTTQHIQKIDIGKMSSFIIRTKSIIGRD